MTVYDWRNTPPEVRQALEPMLKRWGALLPSWVQDVRVAYDGTRDATMSVTTNYRNRWILLLVTGNWMAEAQGERENALRHELAHVLLEPFDSVVERVLDTLPEDTVTEQLARGMVEDGAEAAVEDIARALGRLMDGA